MVLQRIVYLTKSNKTSKTETCPATLWLDYVDQTSDLVCHGKEDLYDS